MKTKVLFLLNGNIRYDGRVSKEINSLKKLNYEVHLIVTEMDDDDVIENYSYPVYKANNPAGHNFVSSILNKFKFYKFVAYQIDRIKPDFIHCNDTTIFYVSLWRNSTKVIYDAHELLPQMSSGFTKILLYLAERRSLKNVYKVILPQIDRLNYFYFQYKSRVTKSQLYLLQNFPNQSTYKNSDFFLEKYGYDKDEIILSYIGVIAEERKLIQIIQAISGIEGLVFFIIGKSNVNYKMQILNTIAHYGLEDRVFIKDPIPNHEVIWATQSSNIGVCFYTDDNLNSYFCASNKLYENLNSGVPVLTNDIVGALRVVKNGVNGYIVSEISKGEIYKALIELIEMDLPKPTEYYWESQEQTLFDIYS